MINKLQVYILNNLTNLINLSLNNNQIIDLTTLSNLTNLEVLRLDDNQIIDLTSLSQLTNLKRLYLNDNQIIDLNPLSQLTKTNIQISALPFIYHQNPTHPLILSTPLKEFNKDLIDQLFEDLKISEKINFSEPPYIINNITYT